VQELAEGIRQHVERRQQSVLAVAERALAEAERQEAAQSSGDDVSSRESSSPAPSPLAPSSPDAYPPHAASATGAAEEGGGEEDDEEEEEDLSDWEYRPAHLYDHQPQSEDHDEEDEDYHETAEARQARRKTYRRDSGGKSAVDRQLPPRAGATTLVGPAADDVRHLHRASSRLIRRRAVHAPVPFQARLPRRLSVRGLDGGTDAKMPPMPS
jgi:hypothetical protein